VPTWLADDARPWATFVTPSPRPPPPRPPPPTLRQATDKFVTRFEGVVRLARERGLAIESASLTQLDSLWDEVKAQSTLDS
jgi:hypothetical protein